ncbi:cation:proton antiporter domain-containing protein [Flavilitoribacter nigricans]|uniref:Sodium:proton exchanger n=1 Tax=Flavilitoribacter nigricans (strain ATCC 23147 / DSM 23189 / NBRC 102662 / NCIMB 1420 / SS-2) TaxID=1122177 RepID=A0A2D0NDQ0_FLAN2|nr:cation:proton antiporter [Flavilitoribacter nigricans]PHN05893.1 sodium:proton exchanger [Flavilitoribacter nigricans DSM 23189 = NBRC 102662]
MDFLTSYNLIIEASVIIILSFFFGEVSRKTNIPSVLMLILLGIGLKFVLDAVGGGDLNFDPILEVLGIIGLIMIVLEAALELKLRKDKYLPIAKALGIALIGLIGSTWIAALILQEFIPGMDTKTAWLYATPLSILSSAIIIPSVSGLTEVKKEFHIYESTFSDILGIMLFYFLTGQIDAAEHSSGLAGFAGNLVLTLVISFIASYLIILVFQNIRSHVKLFLLIAVLLLLYSVGKQMHLSSLIIILIFGLLIANMQLFFRGPLSKWLNLEKAKGIYEGLHVITMETAFVVRTFFFVIFGLTISLASLASLNVALVSGLIILSIYLIRFIILRIFVGADIVPQLYIAPRGLITILLFNAIPTEVRVEGFEAGILLFIIIATSLIMTFAMIYDKRRTSRAVKKAQDNPVGYVRWKAPSISVGPEEKETH